jgi:SAM-dependent methyltransferase
MASMLGALYEGAWTSWARRRYRSDFDRVSTFGLFVGYPRSGHSLVGAMLNAHRHAVIAHELDALQLVLAGCDRDTLYARIVARAAWFDLRGNTGNYAYQVPHQWQGRFERLQVVGDKRGGSAVLAIEEHPDLLDRLRTTLRIPVRLVHVVRNPFDNIAAISLWHRLSIDEAIDYYFRLCRVTAPLVAAGREDVVTLHHEEFIRAPEPSLRCLCRFFDLDVDADYLVDCSRITAAAPSHTRLRVSWSSTQIAQIERRAAPLPFLARYTFEIPAGAVRPAGGARPRAKPTRMIWPRIVLRWFPTEKRPTALAATGPPAADTVGSATDSRYWDETVQQFRRAGPLRAWHAYMCGVYGRLIRDWLPPDEGTRLKSDLFEEAVSGPQLLVDLGRRSVGLDVSFDVARSARQRLPSGCGSRCIVGDLRAIPLRGESINAILSGSSLDHFANRSDLIAGLAELARVLKPGGTLVLTLDNPHNPVVWTRNHLPFRLLKAVGLVPYYVGATLTRSQTAGALRDVGLRLTDTCAVAHAPRAAGIWIVRLAERFAWKASWLPGALAVFDRLSRLPTRYVTGYYLAFRVVKDTVERS